MSVPDGVAPDESPALLVSLNDAPVTQAALDLGACCASAGWVRALIAGRPYAEVTSLVATSDRVFTRLTWPDLLEAVQAHPRIGERAAGGGREAGWSRQEQSTAAASADETTALALAAANEAYERRFGFTFLICAAGKTASQILAALQDRVGNDPDAEREVVRAELAAIVRLRLERAFGA